MTDNNIEIVKKRLDDTSASLVVMNKNGEIREFYNRRVIDIVSLIKSGENFLDGAIIADKVIGKVASALLVLAGVKEIYARTISEYAIEVLDNNNIKYSFGLLIMIKLECVQWKISLKMKKI